MMKRSQFMRRMWPGIEHGTNDASRLSWDTGDRINSFFIKKMIYYAKYTIFDFPKID